MFLGGIYKRALDRLPVGVFIFDKKLRLQFANGAFRRLFPAYKDGTNLRALLSCNKKECGKGEDCPFCTLYETLKNTVETGANQMATMEEFVEGKKESIKLRLRTQKLGKSEYLCICDGAHASETSMELLSAQKMQQRLLPAGKSVGGISYSFMYIPCREVGGDMPDVYEFDGDAFGVISDVSGKGVSAGLLSAFFKAGFDHGEKSLARALRTLSEKFSSLNLDERSYITVAGVKIQKEQKKITFATAGHNVPILLKNKLGVSELEMPAPPISGWFENVAYAEKDVPYEEGDVLVLLTDGITECRNSAGELFGVERVESVLLMSESAEDFIAKLKTALTVYAGGKFTDDITAVAFSL